MMTQNKRSRWLLLMTVLLGMLAAIAPLSTDMYGPAVDDDGIWRYAVGYPADLDGFHGRHGPGANCRRSYQRR